jgi:C1A family cysteine protease
MSVTLVHDLRGKFGAVRNQLDRPTCMSFAASACHEAVRGSPDQLCVEDLHHAAHLANGDVPDPHTAVSIGALVNALSLSGQALETFWPYQDASSFAGKVYTPPQSNTVRFQRTFTSRLSLGAVFEQIAQGNPVVIVLAVCPAFHAAGPVISDHTQSPRGIHAVVGVGVADDGKRLALVRNSWGIGWASGGYAFVSENYLAARMRWAAAL